MESRRKYLDVLRRNRFLDERTDDLAALLLVQALEQRVSADGGLEAFQLVSRLRVDGRRPLVAARIRRVHGLGRHGRAPSHAVVRREALRGRLEGGRRGPSRADVVEGPAREVLGETRPGAARRRGHGVVLVVALALLDDLGDAARRLGFVRGGRFGGRAEGVRAVATREGVAGHLCSLRCVDGEWKSARGVLYRTDSSGMANGSQRDESFIGQDRR